MGIFDKIPFIGKKEEIPEDAGLPPMPDMPSPPAMEPMTEQMQPRAFQQQQGWQQNTEMQIISAKLDAIKAILDSINQRVANLERIAGETEEQPGTKGKWY